MPIRRTINKTAPIPRTRLTADDITGEAYKMYRVYRFGDAGRDGNDGVARAAERHGVSVRAWFMYEAGTRNAKLAQRTLIAKWLNANERQRELMQPVTL